MPVAQRRAIAGGPRLRIRVVGAQRCQAIGAIRVRHGVGQVPRGERVLEITYDKSRVNAGEVLAAVQRDGLGIVDVSTREADLEDVFLSLVRDARG